MALTANMLRELRRIERGLETSNGFRVVVDDDGSRWWRELGSLDRRTLAALESRELVELRADERKRFRDIWQARLTPAGVEAVRGTH